MISNTIKWNVTLRDTSRNYNGKKEEHKYIQLQEDHQTGTVLEMLALTTSTQNNNNKINF